jgi:hypothetical protein
MNLPDYSGQGVENITNADAMNNSKIQDKHFQEQMNSIIARKRQEKAEQARSNAKVERYLNTMPDGIDTSKLPGKYKPSVHEWAKSKQLEFASLAQKAAEYESAGDFTNSVAIKSRMTEIENSFRNVDSQLAQFKSYKDNFLEDSQNGMVSNSVNPNKRNLLSSVYTDELDMVFSNEGNITFLNEEGGYIEFDKIPDYTVKNNKGASEILNMNEAVYKAGKMSPSTQRLYRMKLQNITKSRDEVLSLATDDFITEGGLGILDDDLLYNEERTDELRNMVIDSYMTMFNETAKTSVKRTAKKTRGTQSERKYNSKMNNIMQGISALGSGNWKDLEAYTTGEVLFDEEDGTATIWYGEKDYNLSELNEHALYKIMQEEGVPDNMIPSLDKLRTYFEQPEKQTTKLDSKALLKKYYKTN